MNTSSLVAALQIADSSLPIGRYVHSYGVESWTADRPGDMSAPALELVSSVISGIVAPLDGVLLAHAWRASTIDELLLLDRMLSARKLATPANHASRAPGRALASLGTRLTRSRLAAEFATAVETSQTAGHLAIVQGCLSRALGLTCREAVVVELQSTATSLFSVFVRLGRLSPIRAQEQLRLLVRTIEDAAEAAVAAPLEGLHATGPELEIYLMRHHRRPFRTFAT